MEGIISRFSDMSMPPLPLCRLAEPRPRLQGVHDLMQKVHPGLLHLASPRDGPRLAPKIKHLRGRFSTRPSLGAKPRGLPDRPRDMGTVIAMRLTELKPALADDDQSLAAQARDGDSKAFEQLYRRHVGRVHAVCLRLAGNRALAEECTQDAFIKAWESLKNFRGEASFGTWVH